MDVVGNVIVVSDSLFFTEVEALPASVSNKDASDYVATFCETNAPISFDSLRYGYFRKFDSAVIFVCSAEKAFESISQERLSSASLVVPTSALLSKFDLPDGEYLVDSGDCVAYLNIESGQWKDFYAENVEESKDSAIKNISKYASDSKNLREIEIISFKEVKRGKYRISIKLDSKELDSGDLPEKLFSDLELRPMGELRKKAKVRRKSELLLLGIKLVPITFLLLMIWQANVYFKGEELELLKSEISQLQPVATAVEKESEELAHLRSFTGRKLHSTVSLAIINSARPDNVSISRAIFESPVDVLISGRASSIKDVDDFVQKLKSDKRIAEISSKTESSKSEARYTITVKFKK